MKLLFHCCCAPCATACIQSLSATGITPTLYWYNPNIHPFTEYQSRRDALSAFAASTATAENIELRITDEYGLRAFLSEIGSEIEAPKRCTLCYRMRLMQTAAYAAENGFDAFSTSLLISPYQNHDLIRNIGEELGAQYGIEFLYRDFRPLFREGQAQARSLGLYMQKYCGCIYSEAERYAQRQTAADGANETTPTAAATAGAFFQRLALLTGTDVIEKLAHTSVLVVGVGGVGSWCAEALVRSGVGKITIADFDTVCASNVNRQLPATSRTLGRAKVDVLKQRLLEINPNCEVSTLKKRFTRETAAEFGSEKMNYVIDAIDSIADKLDLIETSCAAGVQFFSSMGMARKLDPTRIKTASIWETQNCPLARLVRQGLRKRNFSGDFTVVYSDEQIEQGEAHEEEAEKSSAEQTDKKINGSVVTVTATAGMVLASLVLRAVAGNTGGDQATNSQTAPNKQVTNG